jgi:type IV pilus assembly protein PilW
MSAAFSMSMQRFSDRSAARSRGFSLIEMMVAIVLGILIGIGLVSLFAATSKTNSVQERMAEMQENGRYAVNRLNYDLRLASRQLMNSSGFSSPQSPTTTVGLAPDVYVASIPFPEGAVSAPAGWPAATATKPSWPMSASKFMQGYACTGGGCTPAVPTGARLNIPATGVGAGSRVQNADVLLMRYLNGQGWTSSVGEISVTCAGGFLINIAVQSVTTVSGTYTYTSQPLNFTSGNLAMLADSSGSQEIFPVTVTPGVPEILAPTAASIPGGGQVRCLSQGDVKLYNFTLDFNTVVYWLRNDADPNPDAAAGRVIPALIRTTANNNPATQATATELVQGVEQMNFLYGFQQTSGNIQYLTADQVAGASTAANCPPSPGQFFNSGVIISDSNCLWRAVSSIETHMLVDSVNNLFSLTAPERMYQYSFPGPANTNGRVSPPVSPATMPNGLDAGAMMRREYITLVSVRNYNS